MEENKMAKGVFLVAVMLLMVWMNVGVFAQPATQDPELQRIIELKEQREQKIEQWEMQATMALAMVILVGVISAVIAFLQKINFKSNKLVTAILGFIIAVITVIDANLYPDPQTLNRTILKARGILEDIEIDLAIEVKPEDRPIWREGIQEKLKEIRRIEDEFLAANESMDFELIAAAYAQEGKEPSWIADPPEDKNYLYFIGSAEHQSLSQAKDLSLADAKHAAAENLTLQIQKTQGFQDAKINFNALSDYLTKSAEIARAHYSLDRSKGLYKYYTLLKLAKSVLEIDLTFFGIQEKISMPETKKLYETLEAASSPRKAYYADRTQTYQKMLEQTRESLEPEDYKAFMQARRTRLQGEVRSSIPALERITQVYPAFFMGWYNLGLAYDALEDSAKADRAYNKAIDLEPRQTVREASIYNTYGDFLRRHENYAAARRYLEKALAINPNHELARNNLRVVQDALEKKRGAK
jgi:tetratricopeptide (TPR) repeat protein